MAGQLRALLKGRGFIRRDLFRRALFVSDYAHRQDAVTTAALDSLLRENGWQVQRENGLTLVDLPYEGYQTLFSSIARSQGEPRAIGLSALFARHETAFLPNMLSDARQALLQWDAEEEGALNTQAGAALAVALREKTPVPSYYPLLLNTYKEADGC